MAKPVKIGDKFLVEVPGKGTQSQSIWEVIDDHGMVPGEDGIERHEWEAKCISGPFVGSTNSFPESDIL